jgi:hypothetical protein
MDNFNMQKYDVIVSQGPGCHVKYWGDGGFLTWAYARKWNLKQDRKWRHLTSY